MNNKEKSNRIAVAQKIILFLIEIIITKRIKKHNKEYRV